MEKNRNETRTRKYEKNDKQDTKDGKKEIRKSSNKEKLRTNGG